MRPNPPKMVTIVLAVGLMIVGLALIYLPLDMAVDLIRAVQLPPEFESQILALATERIIAYICLAAAPLLLIAGSILPGL